MCLREKNHFVNDSRFDLNRIFKCKSLEELEEHFFSKLLDYPTADEYYEASSLDNKIENIRVPTVFLNAANDMLSPKYGRFQF